MAPCVAQFHAKLTALTGRSGADRHTLQTLPIRLHAKEKPFLGWSLQRGVVGRN